MIRTGWLFTPDELRAMMRFFRGAGPRDVLALLTDVEKQHLAIQLRGRRRRNTVIGRAVTPVSVKVLCA